MKQYGPVVALFTLDVLARQVPEYATALDKALGVGALSRLGKDVGKQTARFKDISKQLYRNFKMVARQA